uniref:Uncharacterized protein n=1 Tax=Romanomermis culicivorax TaxID=13658 RepID=A0A915I142_ROMCU
MLRLPEQRPLIDYFKMIGVWKPPVDWYNLDEMLLAWKAHFRIKLICFRMGNRCCDPQINQTSTPSLTRRYLSNGALEAKYAKNQVQ